MSKSIVSERAFNFALKIIFLYQEMKKQNEFVISKQLLRSATSIGANIEEASAACSRKEFVMKISIASKEARETRYWLRLLKESDLIKNLDYSDLLIEINEIIRMLTKTVKTIQDDLNNTKTKT
jgi:four helix bundle protein